MFEIDLGHELFLHKVDRLRNNRYIKLVRGQGSVEIVNDNHPFTWPAGKGMSQQSIDSFVLNFRFLIQDKEGSSNRRVFKDLNKYGLCSPETQNLKQEWDAIRNQQVSFNFPKDTYTYQEMFNLIFYGGMAHYDQAQVEKYLALRFSLVGNMIIMTAFAKCVQSIYSISKSLSKDLKAAMRINHSKSA